MKIQIFILFAAVFWTTALRIPRAVDLTAVDFTEAANDVDPIIDLRKLSVYLLQRLPSGEADQIIKAFAEDSYNRSLNEQLQGFLDVMTLLVKGAWAQVIRHNENETPAVKNHVFESFLLQQVSAVEADKIMNALIKLAYGTTEDEKTEGFSDIVNLLVDGIAAKEELKRLGRVPLTANVSSDNDVKGKLRAFLMKRIPMMEADRIVNLFTNYMQAQTMEEKREANRQLLNLLIDGTLAKIALDGVSPTKMLKTQPAASKNNLAAFSEQNMQLQASLLEHMPMKDANRIAGAFMKVVNGETSDIRDQGEWEIYDILVEGAQAKETLQKLRKPATASKLTANKLTELPTHYITFN